MKSFAWIATMLATASVCFAQAPAPTAPAEKAQPADEKEKARLEARAKQNARNFENNATTIAFYDRTGKRTGNIGERALYDQLVLSPDNKRVAAIKEDQANESADLYVLDAATGAATRLTTSAKTEFVMGPVWSPDSKHIAYVTIRSGQEGLYVRAADGQGPEELLYKNPGAFLNLTDWSKDGRYLVFAKSDLKGGALYILPVDGTGQSQPKEIFHSEQRMFGPRFSPDGRYLSYMLVNQANQSEIYVRPVDSSVQEGPWQVSDGSMGMAYWKRDGKELYYTSRDRSIMVAEVGTSPHFTFAKPKVLFRPPGAVPVRIQDISADGEKFLVLPPPRGPQLQQLTIFDREGKVVKKVGEPGVYATPVFSPDGSRLLVSKGNLQRGQSDLWTIDLASGNSTQVTKDTWVKVNPMWSPDGKKVYYSSMRQNGDWGIYRRAADGTGSEEFLFQYTPGAFLNLSDISADEKYLICESGGVILTVPLTGSDAMARKPVETLREEWDDSVGRLSPDGRFIAFRSDEAQAERGEVYVRPIDLATGTVGNEKWRVSKDGVNAMVHWRADGKEMFFRGQNLNSNDLWVMSVEISTTPTFHAQTPKLLFKLPGPQTGNLGNTSRDGQRFVFAVNVPAAVDSSK